MKLIIIEGLKGTGKTTILKSILENVSLEIFPKYTKKVPEKLTSWRCIYYNTLKNSPESLALNFYENFFQNLKNLKNNFVCDKGIISLGYSGFYGYMKNEEDIEIEKYNLLSEQIYKKSLDEYTQYCENSLFVLLNCSKDIITKRIIERERKIKSDSFFLENLETYYKLHQKYVSLTKEVLKKSKLFDFNNESKGDLINIINTILDEINCF